MRHQIQRHWATGLALVLLAVWFVLLRPAGLGGPMYYLMVRGTSMLPTYRAGDLILLRHDSAYRPGEIVAYRVPAGTVGAGHVVIHRIVGGDGQSGFVMRGDNNRSVDPWRPRTQDVVGTPVVRLPGAGVLLALLHQPVTAGGLGAALAVMVVVMAEPKKRGRGQPAGGLAGREPVGVGAADSHDELEQRKGERRSGGENRPSPA